jgi:hypothetical protein
VTDRWTAFFAFGVGEALHGGTGDFDESFMCQASPRS